MKTRVQLYQPPEGQPNRIPPVLQRARQEVIMHVAGIMRLCGIREIDGSYASLGLKTLLNLTMAPTEDAPPAPMVHLRNDAARHLAEILFSFGILALELQPDEKERQTIRDGWKLLENGSEQSGGQGSVSEIPLNVEPDPSRESVLKEPEVEDVKLEEEVASEEPADGNKST